MEKRYNTLKMGYSDPQIDHFLENLNTEDPPPFTRHFSQGEDFFLQLNQEFTVPSFPIHHDVRKRSPGKKYRISFDQLLQTVTGLAPEVFQGLHWYFNPSETLCPSFYKVYKYQGLPYLFLLNLDLVFHPREGTIVTKGDNDNTAVYRTNKLFLEADIFPVSQIEQDEEDSLHFRIEQEISQTWIGETGRGYFVQGIWIDRELTRFFSKLLMPPNKRTYPYYPYTCKLKTIAHTVINPSARARENQIPYLAKAIEFIRPRLEEIQKAVHDNPFSEELSAYKKFKAQVPPGWDHHWDKLKVTPYLNSDEQKEYRIDETGLPQ